MQLQVDLADRSYPILIDQQVLTVENLTPFVENLSVLVVTNAVISSHYLPLVEKALIAAKSVDVLLLEDGEQYKTMTSIEQILTRALQNKLTRKSVMVALGGGVIGDMTGFAAACYQRGIGFIQIPTTLLAQVDSSVGGKTGINHALGKNMIGAFHQPKAVFIDTTTLDTLPDRELSAGMAEVIKYGLIYDADFFAWLEANMDELMARDHALLSQAIRRSCEIKALIVSEDETEQSGRRALLNLGHTFGHAIETLSGYGRYLHGEAVAIGTMMALMLSVRMKNIDIAVVDRAQSLLLRADLPVSVTLDHSLEDFLQVMSVDKKNTDGQIKLILLKALGEAYLTTQYPTDEMHQVICDFIDK